MSEGQQVQQVQEQRETLTIAGEVFTKVPEDKYILLYDVVGIRIYLGDRRKANKNLWVKSLEGVDVNQFGGWAFVGNWVQGKGYTRDLAFNKNGDMFISVISTGSWRYKGQSLRLYLRWDGKIWATEWNWGESVLLDKKIINKVSEIFALIKSQRGE